MRASQQQHRPRYPHPVRDWPALPPRYPHPV